MAENVLSKKKIDIRDKGGLYGRVSRPIYLAPFTLLETSNI
jgi:hypothetical protein